MLEWLEANREWVFGGIGVFVLTLFYNFFSSFVRSMIEKKQNEKLLNFLSRYINANDRLEFERNRTDFQHQLQKTQDSVRKIEIELGNNLSTPGDKLSFALKDLDYWYEAQQWLENNIYTLGDKGFKKALKKCRHLTDSGKILSGKSNQHRFKQSIYEHIFWMINCLKFQDDESFEENLRHIELVVEEEAYYEAFLEIHNQIKVLSRRRNKRLSDSAQKIITDFLNHLIKGYQPV